ncbi:ribonuclease H-like domain-containing protein [Tanacetum coccineum]
MNENDFNNCEVDENVSESVFDSRSSDGDDIEGNDRFKKVDGYHVVPPPLTGNYIPPKVDLSFAGLDDSVYKCIVSESIASESKVETNVTKTSTNSVEKPKTDRPSTPLIQDDKQAKKPRNFTQSPKVDRKDWNGLMAKKLGLGFGYTKKACFVCGSLSHLIRDCTFHEDRMDKKSVMKNNVGQGTGQRETRPVWNNPQRINHQNKFVPSAVLTKSGRVPVSAAQKSSPRAAISTSPTKPVNTATPKKSVNVTNSRRNTFYKSHSPLRRSFNRSTTPKTNISNEKVNTVRVNGVNTAGQKAVSAVGGNRNTGNPQHTLKNKGVVDSGCSRYMRGNKSYLTDYQDIDGGFVAFGGGSKGGMITGKGKIKIGKLDFEDVYFMKELKFNLFSVSQMYDKKNSVLFTENECLVLSFDFKLLDESQVLLKIPRKNNIYSFYMQNVVPTGGLTCLIAKATSNESNMWHKKLGHVNFKTMNKLVEGNLVREFKNREMNEFCEIKGIKREFSNARTPQQIGVAEKKNRTLIEAARTMLADSLLPVTFWAEAVNTACYVMNRADEGFLVGYSVNSKAFRVYNSRTKKVEENLHIKFLENKPNVAGNGPTWLFDIDSLTNSMNYQSVTARNQTNKNAGPQETNDNADTQVNVDAGISAGKKNGSNDEVVDDAELKVTEDSETKNDVHDSANNNDKNDQKKIVEEKEAFKNEFERRIAQEMAAKSADKDKSTNRIYSSPVNTARSKEANTYSTQSEHFFASSSNVASSSFVVPDDPNMPALEDIGIFNDAYADRDEGVEADFNNLELTTVVSPIPPSKIHKDHPKDQIIGELHSATQTRGMFKKSSEENAMISYINKQRRTNHKDYQNCLLACFLSQAEPKKVIQA